MIIVSPSRSPVEFETLPADHHPVEEFLELWFFLGFHDLQPWVFQTQEPNPEGAPLGLFHSEMEYVSSVRDPDQVRYLVGTYRMQARGLMLEYAMRHLALLREHPDPYDLDWSPSPQEAALTRTVRPRDPAVPGGVRPIFNR